MAKMDKALVGHAEAKVAVEMALLDILGHATGLSIAGSIPPGELIPSVKSGSTIFRSNF